MSTPRAGQEAGDPALPPYRRSAVAVLAALSTDAQHGLSEREASARLDRHGRNELEAEKTVPRWRRFLAQFQNVLVVLLLIATAVSAGMWLYERDMALPYEAIAIFAVVLLNAVIGYIQEAHAEEAVAALRAMSAAQADVIRDGMRRPLPAAELVPGDIILIEEGDTIPADARLTEANALQTAEAPLTGESLPVAKDTVTLDGEAAIGDRRNMVFSGTAATLGRARAVVVATGMGTEMGRIAGMLKSVPEEATLLQKELGRVGRRLGGIVVLIAVVMIATIFVMEEISGIAAILDVLILGVALAVAAIPEGLPAVVTAVLALGVQRMARRNAIVRHLPAVETLGSATIIASDKTGTLTKNEMTVRAVVTASGSVTLEGAGYAPQGEMRRGENTEGGSGAGTAIEGDLRAELERALTIADRANNAVLQEQDGRWTIQGDPTEGALIVAARKAGLVGEALDARFPRVGEILFSSGRKLMTTIHTDTHAPGRLFVFTKGAPDLLLQHCSGELVGEAVQPLSDGRRAEILRKNEALAGKALRSLGLAFRSVPAGNIDIGGLDGPDELGEQARQIEQDLVFAGLIGMIDPPREEAGEAVALAKKAGIRPIMITGDHPVTATVIAARLGIAAGREVLTGAELENLSDHALVQKAGHVSVYARVSPEHKLRIVQALQRAGEVVAMTGDGVNDAPALKTADIGVAMGVTGTDVSREAADMVLADDNFASIVAAVEEGRTIFANIRKFLRYLLSSNIGEVLTMFFGLLLADAIGLRAEGQAVVLPLLATQLLWINLLTDGPPALALGVDPPDHRVMRARPRPREEGVITLRMWRDLFLVGMVMATGTLLVLDASLPGGFIEGSGDVRYAQTMAFTVLVLFQLFNVLNARSEEESAFAGVPNRWLWGSILLALGLQVAVVYTPVLQQAFSTVSLGARDWLVCTLVASSVLWLGELAKLIRRGLIRRVRHDRHAR